MREAPPVFAIACSACRAPLVTTSRIREPEVATLVAHLRQCRVAEPLPDAPPLGEIMRRVYVTTLAPREEPA